MELVKNASTELGMEPGAVLDMILQQQRQA